MDSQCHDVYQLLSFHFPTQCYLHNHLSFVLYFHKEQLEEENIHNFRVVRFEVIPQSVKVDGAWHHNTLSEWLQVITIYLFLVGVDLKLSWQIEKQLLPPNWPVQHWLVLSYCTVSSVFIYTQIWRLSSLKKLALYRRPVAPPPRKLTPPRKMKSSSRTLCSGRSVIAFWLSTSNKL